MTDTLKYRCKNCGYYELKSPQDKTKDIISTIIIFFGLVMLFSLTILIAFKGLDSPFKMLEYAINNDLGLNTNIRERAINITNQCAEGDQDCEAYNLFLYVSNFKYVGSPTYYSFEEIEKEKAGDCKNLARYFVNLANNIGINAWVGCSNTKKHCIAIVKTKNTKYLADATSGTWKPIEEKYDYWNEY